MAQQKRGKILLEKYSEEKKEFNEKVQIAKEYEVSQEQITINKISTGAKILETLVDGFWIIGKFIFTSLIIILLSLAVTVLLNGELRETVLTQLFGFL